MITEKEQEQIKKAVEEGTELPDHLKEKFIEALDGGFVPTPPGFGNIECCRLPSGNLVPVPLHHCTPLGGTVVDQGLCTGVIKKGQIPL